MMAWNSTRWDDALQKEKQILTGAERVFDWLT